MKSNENQKRTRGWYYATLGDYHRELNLDWSYAPTYLSKMKIVQNRLDQLGQGNVILDAGCGEGILVEQYRQKGYQIEGVDLNYESDYVKVGDLRNLPYTDNEFDIVLLLDVFEHFEFKDQMKVLQEINRVLNPGGLLIATIPNLLHLNSRFLTFFGGKLDRADSELDHPGERPLYEYLQLLKASGFQVLRLKGITLTFPILIKFIRKFPRQLSWLHNFLNLFAFPSLSLLTYFECQKRV